MDLKKHIKRVIRYIMSAVPPKNILASISYSQPNERLKGKRIIITGGSRGLGLSMAKKFVSEGADVLITGRDEATLRKVSSDLGCYYLKLDIRDISSFDVFVKEAENKLGKIDCLVNNAGISLHEKSFFDVTPESFDDQYSTNLKGAFFLTQKIISLMKQSGKGGNVLFVSSETGDTVDIRPYGLTKASINSLVQGLAYLLVKDGIRVNAIAPGITASDMTGFKPDGNLYLPINTTERVYLPEEVAEVACFLISDLSGCMSGQIVVCNNARTVNARWK